MPTISPNSKLHPNVRADGLAGQTPDLGKVFPQRAGEQSFDAAAQSRRLVQQIEQDNGSGYQSDDLRNSALRNPGYLVQSDQAGIAQGGAEFNPVGELIAP